MRRQRSYRGQALVELILCLPLFILMLAALVEMGHLFLAKMELAAVCRETAILRSRLQRSTYDNANGRFAKQKYLLSARWIAEKNGRLLPQNIEYQEESLLSLPGTPEAPQGTAFFINKVLEKGAGVRITLRYTMPNRGLRRVLFPQGLILEESLAVKSNFLKFPVQQVFEQFLSGS